MAERDRWEARAKQLAREVEDLERRIRTLKSACEAALTHLKILEHDMPVAGYEQRRDLIKQLEGAIKHG